MDSGRHRYRVRVAEPCDVDELTSLEAAAFAHPWSAEALASTIEHPRSSILVAAGRDTLHRLLGYAAFRSAAGIAELLRIATRPQHQRRGIARNLLSTGLGILRQEGVGTCLLEVRSDNAAAQALYDGLGFRFCGRRRGYYRDGRDALLYRLTL
jgi:ribosomal-protein-alanine N-acetyltransferase